MANHTYINTDKGPGPYAVLSQATVFNGLVFCSGALGVDPVSMEMVGGTIADRTTRALQNIQIILEEAGSSIEKILKVNIFVTSISDVPKLNEAYSEFFKEPRPARACVAVKELARGTDVEIECVAHV